MSATSMQINITANDGTTAIYSHLNKAQQGRSLQPVKSSRLDIPFKTHSLNDKIAKGTTSVVGLPNAVVCAIALAVTKYDGEINDLIEDHKQQNLSAEDLVTNVSWDLVDRVDNEIQNIASANGISSMNAAFVAYEIARHSVAKTILPNNQFNII